MLLKRSEEDEGVDEAGGWVKEGAGKTADDSKAERKPKTQSALVGADDKIELHGAKAATLCVLE